MVSLNPGLYYTASLSDANTLINTNTYSGLTFYYLNGNDNAYINDINLNTYGTHTSILGSIVLNSVPNTSGGESFLGWKTANTTGLHEGSFYNVKDASSDRTQSIAPTTSTSVLLKPGDSIVTSSDNSILNFSQLNIPLVLYPVYGISDVSCFLEGTKILCKVNDEEVYIPIEKLELGTLVKTCLNGFKAINGIGNKVITNTLTLQRTLNNLYVCKKVIYPALNDDLYLLGDHLILIYGLPDIETSRTIYMYPLAAYENEYSEVYTKEGEYNMWNISLESPPKTNYGIYANGLILESCSRSKININYFTTVKTSD